jgi:hypothetical protein
MATKDTEYPEDPACDVRERTQDPVSTKAGTPGAPGFGNFATLRINSVQQTQPHQK